MSLERLCRRLNGGRLTSCKSGKDRTSMSVTLEECSLLKQNHNLDDTAFSRTLATLRRQEGLVARCLLVVCAQWSVCGPIYTYSTLSLLIDAPTPVISLSSLSLSFLSFLLFSVSPALFFLSCSLSPFCLSLLSHSFFSPLPSSFQQPWNQA